MKSEVWKIIFYHRVILTRANISHLMLVLHLKLLGKFLRLKHIRAIQLFGPSPCVSLGEISRNLEGVEAQTLARQCSARPDMNVASLKASHWLKATIWWLHMTSRLGNEITFSVRFLSVRFYSWENSIQMSDAEFIRSLKLPLDREIEVQRLLLNKDNDLKELLQLYRKDPALLRKILIWLHLKRYGWNWFKSEFRFGYMLGVGLEKRIG